MPTSVGACSRARTTGSLLLGSVLACDLQTAQRPADSRYVEDSLKVFATAEACNPLPLIQGGRSLWWSISFRIGPRFLGCRPATWRVGAIVNMCCCCCHQRCCRYCIHCMNSSRRCRCCSLPAGTAALRREIADTVRAGVGSNCCLSN